MGVPRMAGTAHYTKPLRKHGGRVKGKVYLRDLERKGKQGEAMPEVLRPFKRWGLLDTEFDREPLPDVVRPCDLDYIWASEVNVDCGKRVRPHPTMDLNYDGSQFGYAMTKGDKES
jgi:hypothetical protein